MKTGIYYRRTGFNSLILILLIGHPIVMNMRTKIRISEAFKFFFMLLVFLFIIVSCGDNNERDSTDERLWYREPAEEWNEALPLGNGRMGAMVFGGIAMERIQLNEESLWAGEKFESAPDDFYQNLQLIQKLVLNGDFVKADTLGQLLLTKKPTSFRSYQPLGNIYLKMEHGDSLAKDYHRALDLRDGIARVSYKIKEVRYVREYLISAEDDVLVIHLSSSKPGSLTGEVNIARWQDAIVTAGGNNQLKMDGQIIDPEGFPPDLPQTVAGQLVFNPGGSGHGGEHMKFAGRMVVWNSGGSVRIKDSTVVIHNSDDVTILFSAATDYNLNKMNFDREIDPGAKAESILSKAGQKTWKEIKEAHIKEHRSLFDRVSLTLGRSNQDTLPTNERIDLLKAGNVDLGLIELYFQYGRYILMSSSRPPGILPANLSGIWSNYKWAPWEADYHLNINLQAKYWPADQCNLSPVLDPLTGWLTKLSESGSISAEKLYGSEGWLSYTATNPFGRSTPSGSTLWSQFNNGVLDPLAGAWMAMTLWRHYEYSQDESFLRKVYPVLKGAAQFIADILVEDEDGRMVVVPSESPENQYIEPQTGKLLRITKSSTYHISIARAVFDAVITVSALLEKDQQLRNHLIELKEQFPPFKIGEDGTLQEWIEDYKEPEPAHRHMSHLLGLYPFSLITPEQPNLYIAAEKAVERRIAHGCEWYFNIANMYARLGKGDKAFQNISDHLSSRRGSSYFHVGGGGGISGTIAAIAEMLLQSNLQDENGNYIVHLLPALPSAWPDGEVLGLLARGGFEVDMVWEKGKLASANIRSSKDGELLVNYRNKLFSYDVRSGQVISFIPE